MTTAALRLDARVEYHVLEVRGTSQRLHGDRPLTARAARSLADQFNDEERENAAAERRPVRTTYGVVRATTTYEREPIPDVTRQPAADKEDRENSRILFPSGVCVICGHLKGDHERLPHTQTWTCDDDCDEDLNGDCHTGRDAQ